MVKKRKLDYFDAFEKQVEAAVTEAELLIKVIDDYAQPQLVRSHMERAHELENEADAYMHAIYKHLAHDFITPIEREDIIAMAQNLDSIVDYIEDVVRCFYMYDVRDMHDDAREFAKLIKKSCKALCKAMGDFRDFKKSKTFKQLIIDVNANEEEADRLYLGDAHLVRGPAGRAAARDRVVPDIRPHGEVLRCLRARRRHHEHHHAEERVGMSQTGTVPLWDSCVSCAARRGRAGLRGRCSRP